MPRPEVLLLTDIVDSTQITQQLGDARASALWQAHDRQARALLAPWGGREIDKSDGLLLLFGRVADAAGYAAAYHQALAGLEPPLQARVGIHTGALWLRENPASEVALGAKALEVDGLAKAVAARLMSLAGGGQTLLSEAAHAALLAAGQSATDAPRPHGLWRLKGVPEPLAVWAVGPGADTPPQGSPKAWRVVWQHDMWLPVEALPHSLPAERDRFFGRRQALARLAALMDGGARLVSLVGMGGMGKTRLAQRFGWQSQGEFPGGIWFCDLSAAQSADGLVHAVAQGLGLPLTGSDPVAQIGLAIAGRGDCLVLADNFEQLTRHAPATLGRWLDMAPRARFLVTTREVLGLPGEQVLMLEPLDAEEGAKLFASRAESATGQALTGDQAAALDRLVAMLDGMPLALELAASRARLISPSDMLGRMGERFRLLAARSGRVERHASLQAMLDWSWDLLSNDEQAALSQLSVFVGGFDADAAEAVVALQGQSSGMAALDAVASLVDKSLVRPARDGRFAMLEMVREYAVARHLAAHSDGAGGDTAVVRHWRHFAGLSEACAVAHRCADLDNLVAACRAATAARDGEGATGALVNAWAALRLVGPYRVAVELAQAALALPGLSPELSGTIHAVAGSALSALGQADAASSHLAAGLGELSGRPPSPATGRLYLAEGLRQTLTGEVDSAAAALGKALDIAESLSDLRLRADALTGLGRLHDHQAYMSEARQYYESALALARELDDQRLVGGLLGNLGGLLYDLGRLDEARQHYQQSLAACEEAGDRVWSGNACSNLGLVLLDEGRHAEASHYLDRALAIAESCGNVRLAFTVRCNLGISLAAEGKLPLAERQFRQAVDSAAAANDKRAEGQFLGYLAVALAKLGRHKEAQVSLERAEACLGALKDRLSLALLFCDRAEVTRALGDDDSSRAALARAAMMADELQCEPASELRRRLAVLLLPPPSQTSDLRS